MPTTDALLELIPRAELRAMARDGELYFLADSPTPTDTPADVAHKLELVCSPEPHKLIASGWSALWISGACAEPTVHQVCLRAGTRPRTSTEDVRSVSEFVLTDTDVIEAGSTGARMTSERALMHVLRQDERNDFSVANDVAIALEALGISSDSIRHRILDSRSLPFSTRALRRLALVDAVDVVDAFDIADCVEHVAEVLGVAHLESEPADRHSITRCGHRRRENVHLLVSQHAGDIRQQSCPVQGLDLDVHEEDTARRRSPFDLDHPVGLGLQARDVDAVGPMDGHARTARDEAGDLVAGHGRAAAPGAVAGANGPMGAAARRRHRGAGGAGRKK